MKLILQAVKSLFRKLENGLFDLRIRVHDVQDVADTAMEKAEKNDTIVVTARYVEDAWVISHTNADIYNAYLAGKRIVLNYEDPDVDAILVYSTIISVSKSKVTFLSNLSFSSDSVQFSLIEIRNGKYHDSSRRVPLF